MPRTPQPTGTVPCPTPHAARVLLLTVPRVGSYRAPSQSVQEPVADARAEPPGPLPGSKPVSNYIDVMTDSNSIKFPGVVNIASHGGAFTTRVAFKPPQQTGRSATAFVRFARAGSSARVRRTAAPRPVGGAPLTLRQSRPFLQRLVGNSGYGHRLPVRHLRRLASAAGTGALFTPASPGWAPTWTWRNNPGGTAAFFPVSGPSFAASPRMAAGRCQWQRRQWQRRQWQRRQWQRRRRHRQRSFTAPPPS